MQRGRQSDNYITDESFGVAYVKYPGSLFKEIKDRGINGNVFFRFIIPSAQEPVCFLFAMNSGQADVAMI
jgi:hypothetical protein